MGGEKITTQWLNDWRVRPVGWRVEPCLNRALTVSHQPWVRGHCHPTFTHLRRWNLRIRAINVQKFWQRKELSNYQRILDPEKGSHTIPGPRLSASTWFPHKWLTGFAGGSGLPGWCESRRNCWMTVTPNSPLPTPISKQPWQLRRAKCLM